jgi:hypothetical protein
MSKRDIGVLARNDMLAVDENGQLRLVGADIRTQDDDRDISTVEFELNADTFLEKVIKPRKELENQCRLFDDNGEILKDFEPLTVWSDEMVQRYVALRNAARMVRPQVMDRIKIRRGNLR